MPLLKLQLSENISEERRYELVESLSKIVAEGIGKPEQYVMVCIDFACMLMSGKRGSAAYVEIRSIGGLTVEVNRTLSSSICALLQQSLSIPPDRVYLNYMDIKASNWGFNGRTFG